MRLVPLRMVLCVVLVGGSPGCRALTEPDLRPQSGTPGVLVEGRVFGPDGAPLAAGEIRIYNEPYVQHAEDVVDLRVALDQEGRFSLREEIDGRVDVAIVSTPWLDYPDHIVLGLTKEGLPWTLTHPMQDVQVTIDLPQALLDRLEYGSIRVGQSRPRPDGASTLRDYYDIPLDSTGIARGWALPGMHSMRIEMEGHDGWEAWIDYDDSIRVLAEPPLTLSPGFREQGLELIVPEGLPSRAEFEVRLSGRSSAGEPSWDGWLQFPVVDRDEPILEYAPSVVTRLSVWGRGLTLGTQDSWEDGNGLPLEPVEILEVGRYWLELVLSPDTALPERYFVALRAGYDTLTQAFDEDGRALFLLDEGAYLLEVFEGSGWGVPSEVAHRQLIEVEGSQVFYLEF